MWKAETGHEDKIKVQNTVAQEDDWDTGAEEVKQLSEKEQRWSTGKSSDVKVDVPLKEFAAKLIKQNDQAKLKEYSQNSFARGYGGEFGVDHRTKDDATAVIKKEPTQKK